MQFGTDWRRDAERRDFTMNALYADATGTLFDPIGGIDDALIRRVRFIGDPDVRIAEDRLRVYRFFRFSASHGGEHLDAAGLDACRRVGGPARPPLGRARRRRDEAHAGAAESGADAAGDEPCRASSASAPKRSACSRATSSAPIRRRSPRASRSSSPRTAPRPCRANGGSATARCRARPTRSPRPISCATAASTRRPTAIPSALADAQSLAAVIDHWPPERAGEVRGLLSGLDGPEVSRLRPRPHAPRDGAGQSDGRPSSRASRRPGSRAASPSTSRRCSQALRG